MKRRETRRGGIFLLTANSGRQRFAVALSLFFSFVHFCRGDVDLRNGVIGRFADVDEGVRILTTKDEFIVRMSPFDRSARMKTDKAISEAEFLRFIEANVRAWTADEKRTVGSAIERVRPGLDALSLSLPKVIYFVKTTGAEEGKAFYTRDTAIVLPEDELISKNGMLEKVICHELFHIFSRENPALREKLYEIIGFTECPEIEFPLELKSRKITNPDAPRNGHLIRLRSDGREILAVPILFSKVDKYDLKRGGEFFDYLQFKFLELEKAGPSYFKPAMQGTEPKLHGPEQVIGFFEQIGRNTQYVIHPEEILADNFAILVMGQTGASPEILQKMKDVLGRK